MHAAVFVLLAWLRVLGALYELRDWALDAVHAWAFDPRGTE